MISDKLSMFPVDLEKILPEEGMPFPLFLHLPMNKRYIPIRLTGDPIGQDKYNYFKSKQVKRFWIPETFRDKYEEYLKRFDKAAEVPKPVETPVVLSEQNADGIFEETEIVADVLQDEDLSQEAKAEILASLGQDLLRSFNQISNKGTDGQQEAVKRGRQIADEILAIAAQDSNIYDEILALRQSKQDIEHSIMVSTLSVMFGLALGFADEILLADIATAGLFHDVGLTRVNPLILAKPESEWSATDLMQYQEHVEASVSILKNAKAPYNELIFTMIRQHHENYDGTGFPEHLRGMSIPETSQLLHLANWFDRLTSGKIDGMPLSPAESLDKIFQQTTSANTVKEIQPELIQRVFQFMLDEKEAAENLMHEANSRVDFISNTAVK